MGRNRRRLTVLLGAVLLIFGLGCLNYTKADGLERHRAVAARHNLPPPPSNPILYGGVLSVAVGSGVIGFAIGRRGEPTPVSDGSR